MIWIKKCLVVGVDLAREQDTNVTSSGLTFIEENLFEKNDDEFKCPLNMVFVSKNQAIWKMFTIRQS